MNVCLSLVDFVLTSINSKFTAVWIATQGLYGVIKSRARVVTPSVEYESYVARHVLCVLKGLLILFALVRLICSVCTVVILSSRNMICKLVAFSWIFCRHHLAWVVGWV